MDRRVRVSPSSTVLRGDDEGRRDEMTVFMQSGLNCRKLISSVLSAGLGYAFVQGLLTK